MQKLLEIKGDDGRVALAGFRLKRVEMYNWGTFHGKVECLIPEGRWCSVPRSFRELFPNDFGVNWEAVT